MKNTYTPLPKKKLITETCLELSPTQFTFGMPVPKAFHFNYPFPLFSSLKEIEYYTPPVFSREAKHRK